MNSVTGGRPLLQRACGVNKMAVYVREPSQQEPHDNNWIQTQTEFRSFLHLCEVYHKHTLF